MGGGTLRANRAPLGTIRPLDLSGAQDQELVEQGANERSRSRASGAYRASGVPQNRANGTTVEIMGHGAPGVGLRPQIKSQWSPMKQAEAPGKKIVSS